MIKRHRGVSLGVFAGGFVGALLAFFPLSLIVSRLDVSPAKIIFGRVSGTIWRGSISDIYFAERRVGDGRVALSAWSLLRVRPRLDVALFNGPVKGQARVLVLGKKIEVRNADGLAQLGALNYRDPTGRPLIGQLSFHFSELSFVQGECVGGAGRISTDVLSDLALRYAFEAPLLQGDVVCEQGRIKMNLNGKTAALTISIIAEVDGELDYTATIEVEAMEANLGSVLELYGFDREGNHYSFMERGNLAAYLP